MADRYEAPAAFQGAGHGSGLLSSLVNLSQQSMLLLVAASLLGALFIWLGNYGPTIDPREPPVLKSTVPIIGHIMSLIRYQSSFLSSLDPEQKRAIATLPILRGKMYAIWDPVLNQAAMKSKDLSFEPFAIETAQKILNVTDETFDIIKTEKGLIPAFFASLTPSLSGQHLDPMNEKAMASVSKVLLENFNGSGWHEIPNLWFWIKDLMILVSTDAIYGDGNPFRKDDSLRADLCTFDEGTVAFMTRPWPRWTAAKPWAARERLGAALGKFYSSKLHEAEDVAQICKARYAVYNKYGLPEQETARMELALPMVAVTNIVSAMYWFAVQILTRPDLVDKIRQEVARITEPRQGAEVFMDIARFEEASPTLVACYYENLRLNTGSAAHRRVIDDTIIKDADGKTYLLKKGVTINARAGISHTLTRVWGPDVNEFHPERFLDDGNTTKASPESEKAKKVAFHPFGGGKHLCPGRHVTFAEMLMTISVLVMTFDIEPGPAGTTQWKVPTKDPVAAKPAPLNSGEGFGIRLRRRAGWEDKIWTCRT